MARPWRIPNKVLRYNNLNNLKQGAHLQNKSHEIWKTCMMQHINKLQWNNAHYVTRYVYFMKNIWQNSFIALIEERLRNFRRIVVFNIDSNRKITNKLCVIYFPNVQWAANTYVARSIFMKYLSYNMFHRCAPCLISARIRNILSIFNVLGNLQFFRVFIIRKLSLFLLNCSTTKYFFGTYTLFVW